MLRALLAVAVFAYTLPASAQISDDRITSEVTPTTLTIAECAGKTLEYTASVVVHTGETNGSSSYVLEFGTACGSDSPASTYSDCVPGEASCCQQLVTNSMPTPSSALGETLELKATVDVDDVIDCGTDPKTSIEFVLKLNVLTAEGGVLTDDNDYVSKTEQVSLSLTRPGAPGTPEVSAGETTIDVTWDDDGEHKACAFQGDIDAADPMTEQELEDRTCSGKESDGAVKITGLERGRTYNVALSAYDGDGNESLPSPVVAVTTQEVTDFYEMYRREYGGGDPGGYCATTPGSTGGAGGFALLCFVGLGLALGRRPRLGRRRSLRRRRRSLTALLVVGLAAVAAPAFAESPKTMTFEFRVGSWLPDIDSEFSGLGSTGADGPYKTTFGDDALTMIDLEFAGHVYQGYGTGSIGVGIGSGSVTGKGVQSDGSRSTEQTSLGVFPLSLFAAYAFDWPAERWGFPIIPYGKLGVDWVLWEITDGEGETSSVSDPEGQGEGGTLGWHYAVGARLLLDALSPEMARTFDLDMGVNNSYLFVEWLDATIDDFGDDNALHLGSEVVFWGLAFDF